MARVNTDGFDLLARVFMESSVSNRSVKERMIKAGGEKMAEAIRKSADAHGLRKTGKLIGSIKTHNMVIDSDSASIDVSPMGTRKNGRKTERNAVVGFVQEHGRIYKRRDGSVNKRAATKFFAEAENNSADEIANTMIDIWREAEKL